MSTPPPITPQLEVSTNSGENALESQQKEKSVVISADPINAVNVELAGSGGRPPLLSSIRKDEAVVTRRELWSYYRQSFFLLELRCPHLEISFKVYYNGNNVCKFILFTILFTRNCSKSV